MEVNISIKSTKADSVRFGAFCMGIKPKIILYMPQKLLLVSDSSLSSSKSCDRHTEG